MKQQPNERILMKSGPYVIAIPEPYKMFTQLLINVCLKAKSSNFYAFSIGLMPAITECIREIVEINWSILWDQKV